MTVRFVPYPPRAHLPFGLVPNSFGKTLLQKLAATGATIARMQFAWSGTETYSGIRQLSAEQKEALKTCRELGLKPAVLAAYGPPWETPQTLTVGTKANVGERTIKLSAGTVASVVIGTDFVILPNEERITEVGTWAYYGSIIESVNAGAKTITLGSKLTVELQVGEKLLVNRLRYQPIKTNSLTDASLLAYMAYVNFLAAETANAGCEGWVTLWNEDPWAHDPWDHGFEFFDTPPAGWEKVERGKSILELALKQSLPASVRLTSGFSDKTGSSGIFAQEIPTTAAQIAATVTYEGLHPYGNNPERACWNTNVVLGSREYEAVNPEDSAINFKVMAYEDAVSNTVLRPMATEDGTFNIPSADEKHQAIELLRQVISKWGMGVIPITYALTTGELEANPFYILEPGTEKEREAYKAFKRLGELLAALGGVEGLPCSVPVPIGCPEVPSDRYPLMTTGIYGANGGIQFAWQRTFTPTLEWPELPAPTQYEPTFFLLPGWKVKKAVVVRTNEEVLGKGTQGSFKLAIGEEPVAIITER